VKDYGKLLMWSAVLVSMPRWAGAFISADVAQIPTWVDTALHYGNLVSGFGMGLLEVLASAYMLEAWGQLKPRKTYNAKSLDHRWVVLTVFVAGLFLLMPFILAPYVVSRMTAVPIGKAISNEFWRHAWAVAVVLSPAFIVGGVAVASGDLVSGETDAQPKTKPAAQPKLQPATQPSQPVAPEVEKLNGTRALVYQIYKRNPRATQQDVANSLAENHGVEISRQAVGKHKRALNGVLK
jgi:pyruvate/2-oxoglutarate dehydrogenase complex dihydrolipoamide acyltransferase (E2) component